MKPTNRSAPRRSEPSVRPALRASALAAAGLVATLAGALLMKDAAAATLDEVRERGTLRCGVNPDLRGFSQADSLGRWSGLDVDFCRAVATAVTGDPGRVVFVPVNAGERFDRLGAGDYDVLARNTTWTLDRNVRHGAFVGVNYYDGQGFMVEKRRGLRSALELDGRPVCVTRDTTTELNAADFFAVAGMRYRPVYYPDTGATVAGYAAGECEALTTDRSGLAALRADLERPDAHRVLPEIVSKEPLGPMVRSDDPGWENIVRWTLACMVNAEEMGITSANATDPGVASTPAARRLVGSEGDAGPRLGLGQRWCRDVVTSVGNYGESYARNVGPGTALGLARGVNALWTDGGLMYAPPIR